MPEIVASCSCNNAFFCEKPIKSWTDYNINELRPYLVRNIKKTDCSFILKDSKDHDQGNGKVLKSFRWMLSEISPVLKKLLENEENLAKNCENIEIHDPNFGAVLDFAHTKSLVNHFNDLFTLYTVATIYKIKMLEDQVIEEMNKNPSCLNFVDLYEFASKEYNPDEKFSKLFDMTLQKKNPKELINDLKKKIEKASQFNSETFDKFFDIISKRFNPTICFQVAEAFLIKHVFDGVNAKPAEEQSNIERNAVDFYLQKINFALVSKENFRIVLSTSNLLEMKLKARIERAINDKNISFNYFLPEN